MPLTPLHLGPGLAAKVVGGRFFSLTAYIIANVLIDVEPGVKVLIGTLEPLHTLHTTEAGLVFAIAATVAAVLPPFRCSWIASALGSAVGIATHLFFDALFHYDVAQNFGVPDLALLFPPTMLEIWLAMMIMVFGGRCWRAVREEYDEE
jgi:hypothetical protein